MLQKSPILDPSLRNLSYILRHREWWPDGFTWNYRVIDCCGWGLCEKLWNGMEPSDLPMGPQMGSFDDIFVCPVSWWRMPFRSYKTRMSAVTPEMVADRIDDYCARVGAS